MVAQLVIRLILFRREEKTLLLQMDRKMVMITLTWAYKMNWAIPSIGQLATLVQRNQRMPACILLGVKRRGMAAIQAMATNSIGRIINGVVGQKPQLKNITPSITRPSLTLRMMLLALTGAAAGACLRERSRINCARNALGRGTERGRVTP